MLQAFIDDSGTHSGARVFVLGGYVSTPERWEQFVPAWQAALEASPAIPYFHGREFFSPQGRFGLLTRDEKRRKIRALCEVIADHAMYAVNGSVLHNVYDRLFRGKVSKLYDDPYFVCLCVIDGILGQMTAADEPVHIVIDPTRGRTPRAVAYLNDILPSRKGRVRAITIADDKMMLPLQAADLYAWRFARRSQNRESRETMISDEWEPLLKLETLAPSIADGAEREEWKGVHASLTVMRAVAADLAVRFPSEKPRNVKKRRRENR